MEQRLVPGWTLIAPRKETIYRFEGADRSDYPPVCRPAEEQGWNSWHCLGQVPRKKQLFTLTDDFAENYLADDNTRSAIETLPSEIVGLILKQLLVHQDVINFGISSPVLWRHVLAHLRFDCARTSGALRSVEVSLLCDVRYDLPESFKRNNHVLINNILKRRLGRRQIGPFLSADELNRSSLCTDKYAEMETVPEIWMRTLQENAQLQFSQREMSRLVDELHWACKIAPFGECIPDPRIWVLRNLSKMKYVRCCRDARGGGRVFRGGKPTQLAVEDVIFWHIQCSDASTGYYGQAYSFTTPRQCSWSGHCLDIVLLDDVAGELLASDETSKETYWEDVTEEVFYDMKGLSTAISRYNARVNEYRGPWYALKNDMGRCIRNKKS